MKDARSIEKLLVNVHQPSKGLPVKAGSDVDLVDGGTLLERLKATDQLRHVPRKLRLGMAKTRVIFHVDQKTGCVAGFHFDPPPTGRKSG